MASYEGALEAAGAVVHVSEFFGSYQGDWWAKVTYEGTTGWVHGSFGSCSGCDALQAEFDYDDEPEKKFKDWAESWKREGQKNTRWEWQKAKTAFQKRYADFGRSYLGGLMTQEEAEAEAGKHLEWDSDAQQMLDFLRTNK